MEEVTPSKVMASQDTTEGITTGVNLDTMEVQHLIKEEWPSLEWGDRQSLLKEEISIKVPEKQEERITLLQTMVKDSLQDMDTIKDDGTSQSENLFLEFSLR